MNIKPIYNFVLYSTLIFLIVVPGSALVVVKAALLVLLFFMTSLMLVKKKVSAFIFFNFVFWLSFILIWLLIGILNNDFNDALREGITYMAFMFFLICMIIGYKWINEKGFTTVLIGSIIAYALLKLSIILAVIFGMISPIDLYYWLADIAPGAVVSSFMGDGLPRVVLPNDYILSVFFAWLLIKYGEKEINLKVFIPIIILTLGLIIITLSRYIYIASIITLIIYLSLYVRNQKALLSTLILILITIIIGTFVLIGLGYSDLLVDRFSGANAASSDAAKSSQMDPLIDLIDVSPLIGQGFGLSLESTGRGGGTKGSFQAEVQWVSLITKIGLIGISIIVILISIYYYIIIKINSIRIKIFVFSVLTLWLLAGFLNPVMLLTTTTINYLLIYAIAIKSSIDKSTTTGVMT